MQSQVISYLCNWYPELTRYFNNYSILIPIFQSCTKVLFGQAPPDYAPIERGKKERGAYR